MTPVARSSEPRLPDAELDVLTCLRRAGEATAREVGRALEAERPMAHGSVVTLLTRLEAKGLVARRKGPVGKAFLFRPTRLADPTLRRVLARWAGRLLGGDRVSLVASLLESDPPSAGEIARLRELLAELGSKRRAGKTRR